MTDDAIAPGWYPDPVDTGVQQYWDGEQWVGGAIPLDQTPPATPPAVEPVPPPVPAPEDPSRPAPGRVATSADARPGAATTVPAPPAVPTEIRARTLAPLSARFMARFVDILAVLGLNIVVNGWFVYQWWREVAPVAQRFIAGQLDQIPEITERATHLQYAYIAIGIGLWFAYEVPALASTGQTLGKRLFEIKVIGYDGEPVGFAGSLRRWFLMAISHPVISPCLVPLQLADVLWCTWDKPLRQCLHDKFARTVVVQAEPSPPTGANTGPTEPPHGA